jgi:SM-20-related protein
VADQLAEEDYAVLDGFMDPLVFETARSFLETHLSNSDFRNAGIGALNDFQVAENIRNDRIFWLDKERDTEIRSFFELVENTIFALNRLCFLSISGYEFHLAHYPEGSFYKKHLDQFNDRNNRMISMIIYLNRSWKEGNGGELRVYHPDESHTDIAPLPGRLVLLRSDRVWHEVLPTFVSRYSITGWLLYQPSSLGYLMG